MGMDYGTGNGFQTKFALLTRKVVWHTSTNTFDKLEGAFQEAIRARIISVVV